MQRRLRNVLMIVNYIHPFDGSRWVSKRFTSTHVDLLKAKQRKQAGEGEYALSFSYDRYRQILEALSLGLQSFNLRVILVTTLHFIYPPNQVLNGTPLIPQFSGL